MFLFVGSNDDIIIREIVGGERGFGNGHMGLNINCCFMQQLSSVSQHLKLMLVLPTLLIIWMITDKVVARNPVYVRVLT